jgi:hypothetical protein
VALVALCAAGLWREAQAFAERSAGPALAAPAKSGTRLESPGSAALRFEPNRGQFEGQVRFVARGPRYGLYLTDEGATLALLPDRTRQEVVTMRLVGGRNVEPLGSATLAGHSNYLVGNDRSKWRSGIESYGRVTYHDVLPGVDVVYRGSEQAELEYDLLLDAGVDPAPLEIELAGVALVTLDASGNAVLRLASGEQLLERAPVAYQTNAAGERLAVSSRYELRGQNRLGFVVGQHDRRLPLVIDPVLSYATYLGGQNFDQLYGVATDQAGNTYVAGYTTGFLFPTINPYQGAYLAGGSDAVICKISPTGSGFIYSTYLGGTGADQAYAVATDGAGNTYVGGVTYSTDFPTVNAFQAAPGGGGLADTFVAKLDSVGASLFYSTYLGGNSDDFPRGIATTTTGQVFVVGSTFSSNFPLANAYQNVLKGGQDAFITAFNPAGTTLAYSTLLGGTGAEYGNAITALPSGEVMAVGNTSSSNFPTQAPFQATFGGGSGDAFVTRLSANGATLVNSTYLGGQFGDEASAVTSVAGAAVVVGYTTSTNFPTALAAQPAIGSVGGVRDAFVTRFNAAGSALVHSTYLGGSGEEWALGVAADANYSYVVGYTASANFPLLSPLLGQSSYGGAIDGFVAAYTAGGVRSYATYLGGSAEDKAVAVALQPGKGIHIAGNTLSPNFPVLSPLPAQNAPRGSQDGFVVRSPVLDLNVAVPANSWRAALLLAGLFLGAGLLRLPRRAGLSTS